MMRIPFIEALITKKSKLKMKTYNWKLKTDKTWNWKNRNWKF